MLEAVVGIEPQILRY